MDFIELGESPFASCSLSLAQITGHFIFSSEEESKLVTIFSSNLSGGTETKAL